MCRGKQKNLKNMDFWMELFDKWLHKVTFWSQVNAYPFEALNLLSLKQLQIDIQHIAVGGGSA
jgi:hypothetical protein